MPALVAAGVTVTVNSDDPPMFSTDLNTEYASPPTARPGRGRVAELARGAVRQSFAAEPLKARIIAEIDAYLTAHTAAAANPG